jgi:hypothetical protein
MAMFESPQAAEKAFYSAFEQGDIEAMMSVWAARAEIRCIHPLGSLLTGVSAVRASWIEIFRNQVPRSVEIERVSTVHGTDLAWHTVYETITLPLQRQRFPPLLATNAYCRNSGGWVMVLHHASPIGMVDTAPFEVREPAATRH